MKLQTLAIPFLALFALTACKGAEAVEKLGEIEKKACSCEDDAECIEAATKMAEEWVVEYKDAMGGDADKAEEHMNAILKCSPAVVMGFAAAAE